MFGYIVANIDQLNEQEDALYRSSYCGLCSSLGRRHGLLSRATINYDMTFLIILLSAVYEADWESSSERCVVHPSKKHEISTNRITGYAADMNVILAYYNLIDDWNDDRKVHSLIGAGLLKKAFKTAAADYPAKVDKIGHYLDELAAIEKSGSLNPDIPADCFGRLMSELIDYRNDDYSPALIEFGYALGRFIYIMDACMDLRKDIKSESYNPMITTPSESFDDILNLLMAECIDKYRLLPVKRDNGLIENILYSGVWTKYERENIKK